MNVTQAISALAEANRGQLRSPQTVRFYNQRLFQFGLYVGLETQLAGVTREKVRGFLASLPARYTPETVRATAIAVKRLFAWAEGEGIIQSSPIGTLPLPAAKGTQRPSLKPEEARTLLEAFPKTRSGRRWRTMTLLAIDTGLRVSELCSLEVSDVEGNRIQVRKGKGLKPRVVFMGNRASKAVADYLKGDRFVPLPAYKAYLWTTRDGRHVRAIGFRKALVAAGDRVGVHVHPHMLRRTFATLLVRHGGDVFSLQELMGHASIQTTRRYVQQDEERLQAVHRKAGPGDLL